MIARVSSLGICVILPAVIVQLLTSPLLSANAGEIQKADRTNRFYTVPETPDREENMKYLLGETHMNQDTNSGVSDDTETLREGIRLLLRMLPEMDPKLPSTKKRTCKVNLGGNCATEEAASMTDHWHFLQSALSPGRRRRRSSSMTPPKHLVPQHHHHHRPSKLSEED